MGENDACVLRADGGGKCRDLNGAPVEVMGVSSGIDAIVGGAIHKCVVTMTGAVECWGYNGAGQLGNGTKTDSLLVPVKVTDLSSGVLRVAAGMSHSCAVTTTGAVKCWGNNSVGKLGNNSTTQSLVPVDVAGLSSGVLAIAAGPDQTCAVTSEGGVKCWGGNSFGQLGNNSTTKSLVPVDVTGLSTGVVALAAGWSHTCALTSAGAVTCWGDNQYGQLGNDTTISSLVPVEVDGLSSGVVALSAGAGFTCALTNVGAVKCFGGNEHGELGNNTTTNSKSPFDVVGLSAGVVAIDSGVFSSCALMSNGGVKCWGTWHDNGGALVLQGLVPVDLGGF